jgi:hypothetical protein
MEKILTEISVMVLGELLRSPRYKETDMDESDVVADSVLYARLLLKELSETQK